MWTISAYFAISKMFILGLEGDSNHTNFVFSLIKEVNFSSSYRSQKFTSIPLFVITCEKNLVVPPYTSLVITTFSPGSTNSPISVTAAIPEAIPNECIDSKSSTPSRDAIVLSKSSLVGLPLLP